MIKLFLFTFLLPLAVFSQTDSLPRNAQGKYEYTAVVNADSLSAEKLYSNAKIFLVTAFVSGKDVTQLNDDAAKTVAGKGSIAMKFASLNSSIQEYVNFKLIIQCKDGRYKYTINNFELTAPGAARVPLENEKALKHYATKNMLSQVYKQTNENVLKLIEEMKKDMKAKTDW